MDSNYSILGGLVVGLLISQPVNVTNRFYDLLFISDKRRDERLLTHIAKNEEVITLMKEELMTEIRIDIQEREEKFTAVQQVINRKIALAILH